jgi:inosine/xanthosine triphosphatase
MKIAVGTTNEAKLGAVKETFSDYKMFSGCEISGISVESGVADQPMSLDETVQGAQNRARRVFEKDKYDLGLGIESGLMQVPGSKTGYMDFCICSIFDGKEFHMGVSCGFECPKEVSRLMHEEGLDMTQAANKAGLSTNPKLGAAEGLIGILTGGRITRKDYTKQAIITALVHLENKELY